LVTQAGEQHADKAEHPGTATSTRPPDKLNKDGTLDGDAGGGVEQDGPKLPQPDGGSRQADGVTIKGKGLRPGRQEAKGCLEAIQRRAGAAGHGRLPKRASRAVPI
jgi:hypothetical protein